VIGGTRRDPGLAQGHPYSPVAMELFLYEVLDAPALRDPASPPRLRFADNIASLSRSVSDAELERARCQSLLSAHSMTLKDQVSDAERVIADLGAGETTQLLGFSVALRNGRVTYDVTDDAWEELRRDLRDCHLLHNPPAAARAVITGWVAQRGPAVETRREPELTDLVATAAHGEGYPETDRALLTRRWTDAHVRWLRLITRAEQRDTGVGGTREE